MTELEFIQAFTKYDLQKALINVLTAEQLKAVCDVLYQGEIELHDMQMQKIEEDMSHSTKDYDLQYYRKRKSMVESRLKKISKTYHDLEVSE